MLVEKHIINKNHSFYNECDSLCLKSKNLYNQGLYNVRQHYFENKKYLNYVDNFHKSKSCESYKELPAKVSNQTLKLVDQNFKSFFSLLKKKNGGGYKEKIKIPQYLDKINGRCVIKYEKQALGLRHFKKTGNILLSKTDIKINTKINDWSLIKEVRIVPRNCFYVIEVVYERKEKNNNNTVIAAIDPGLNNLTTITFNNGITPLIINGKPLKSINQYYNKKRSKLQSELEKKQKSKKSKSIIKLINKRNNKVNDYLHKASRLLVNQLVSNSVKTLVMGKNIGQKQDINIGKRNNQNFVQIPIFKLLEMIKYKCELEGINVIIQEESYTSKASFLNMDTIPKYLKGDNKKHEFSGYRFNRGLYKIRGKKIFINADVNGSYNILRKAIPNAFVDGIEGFAVNPIKLNV